MRRLLRWMAVLLALPVLLLALALLAAATPPGLRLLGGLAERQVPGLRLEGLAGPLPWQLTARRITLGDWLELDTARVELAPAALLRGRLHVRELSAARLAVTRLPPPGEAAPPQPGPMLPEAPHLPLALRLDRLAVPRIELAAAVLGQPAVLGLEARAALAEANLDADARLQRLDAPGHAALRLALRPGDRLSAELDAAEPSGGVLGRPLALHLRLDGPATAAGLALTARFGPDLAVQAQGVLGAAADGALTLRGQAEANGLPMLPPAMAGLAAPLKVGLDLGLSPARVLMLRAVRLTAPFGEARAQGSIALDSAALDLALEASLAESTRFGALLPAGLGWQAVQARARLGGTLSAPSLTAEATPEALTTGLTAADAALGPAPRLTLTLALPAQRLDARLTGEAATLRLRGTAGEALDLAATLELPRLAALGPGFEGSASLRATARGPQADPALTLAATAEQVRLHGAELRDLAVQASVVHPATRPDATAEAHGLYAGQPLTLALRARPEGDAILLDRAEASWAGAELTAEGRMALVTRLARGSLRLSLPELHRLAALPGMPALAGALRLEAELAPQGDAQGAQLKLDGRGLALGGIRGAAVQAEARGTLAELGFTLGAQAPQGQLTAQGSAASDAEGWRLALARLEARAMGETLRLASPARISGPAAGGVLLAPLALTTGRGGRLELRGRWGPERADLDGRLTALPLALAQAAGLDLAGQLDGTLRLSGPVAQPEANLRLNARGVRLKDGPFASLPAANLGAEARLAGAAMTLDATADAGAIGRLRARANLPQGAAGALDARLDGALAVAPLAAPFLAAGADRVTGRLAVALRAGGTLAAPALGGRVALSDGSYRNQALGVALRDITGSLVGDQRALRLDGVTARTGGGGSLALAGTLNFGEAGLPADLTLTAQRAQPWVSDLGTATLDADLRLAGPLLDGARASGSVTVQRAELRLPERLPAGVASLGPVREVGPLPPGRRRAAPAAAPASAMPPLGLDIALGVRRAFVRGRGLEAELGGDLRLGGTSAAPEMSGGLSLVRGTLSVLARRLTFSRGSIAFQSGTLTPQLDFAATTSSSTASITVALAGPPSDLKVTFSSSPELPQDEVLARLVFDRPTSNLSPFEIAQLANAVAELTGATSATGVLDRVRAGLGLDRLGVTGDPSSATGATVEAGRYVAPGLFLGVRQGTTGSTGVGVQYEITPRLKLEGQTATGPGGDRVGLSYELEY